MALLEASVSHDSMHSTALRLVLSPSILPQIAQPPLDEVIFSAYPCPGSPNLQGTHRVFREFTVFLKRPTPLDLYAFPASGLSFTLLSSAGG